MKEANFALFWGLAIQLYESTLISDDSPFDRFKDGDMSALTPQELAGRDVFEGQGQCIACHATPMFTKASTLHLIAENQEEGLVERMLMGQEKFRYMVSGGGFVDKAAPTRTILAGEAGSFDLPSTNPVDVGGQFQIRLAGGPPCHYEVDSFLLNPDNDLGIKDAVFHGELKNGSVAECVTGVTVTIIDNGSGGGKNKTRDVITVLLDGQILPIIDDELDGGNFKITGAALYDNGHYNIGTRPSEEDPGIGGMGPFGNPLSFTRQYLDLLLGENVPDPFQIDECTFEIPFHPVHDLTFFPGGFDLIDCDVDGDGSVDFTTGRPTNNPANQDAIRNARVAVEGAFKVPTVRNTELTGPFFHNGGQATLEQVALFYNRGADFARGK